MIDPVIFTIRLGGFQLPVRWYGIIIMSAVLLGTWVATREIRRRGEDPEFVWDALVYVLVTGIIGARLWYVLNDILGGGKHFQAARGVHRDQLVAGGSHRGVQRITRAQRFTAALTRAVSTVE